MTTPTEQETLARQLWALYTEALGYMASAETGWDDLAPYEREAWIQVVQFLLSNYMVRDDNTPDHK